MSHDPPRTSRFIAAVALTIAVALTSCSTEPKVDATQGAVDQQELERSAAVAAGDASPKAVVWKDEIGPEEGVLYFSSDFVGKERLYRFGEFVVMSARRDARRGSPWSSTVLDTTTGEMHTWPLNGAIGEVVAFEDETLYTVGAMEQPVGQDGGFVGGADSGTVLGTLIVGLWAWELGGDDAKLVSNLYDALPGDGFSLALEVLIAASDGDVIIREKSVDTTKSVFRINPIDGELRWRTSTPEKNYWSICNGVPVAVGDRDPHDVEHALDVESGTFSKRQRESCSDGSVLATRWIPPSGADLVRDSEYVLGDGSSWYTGLRSAVYRKSDGSVGVALLDHDPSTGEPVSEPRLFDVSKELGVADVGLIVPTDRGNPTYLGDRLPGFRVVLETHPTTGQPLEERLHTWLLLEE